MSSIDFDPKKFIKELPPDVSKSLTRSDPNATVSPMDFDSKAAIDELHRQLKTQEVTPSQMGDAFQDMGLEARHALGLYMGDEAIPHAMQAIGKIDPTLSKEDYQELFGDKDFYTKTRDEERDALKAARERSPIATKIGAALGLGVVGAPMLAHTATGLSAKAAAQLFGQGALVQGLASLGESEGETPQEVLKDTAAGAAVGGTVNATAGLALNWAAHGFGKWLKTRLGGVKNKPQQAPKPASSRMATLKEATGDDVEAMAILNALDEVNSDIGLPKYEIPHRPQGTKESQRLAEFSGHRGDSASKVASDIEYLKSKPHIVEDRVHLDPTKENNLADKVVIAYQKAKQRIKALSEQVDQEVLDPVSVDMEDVMRMFNAEKARLQNNKLWSGERESALDVIKKYVYGSGDLSDPFALPGAADIKGHIPASSLRELIIDMRRGLTNAYTNSGKPINLDTSTRKSLAAQANKLLHEAVKKHYKDPKKYDHYVALMKQLQEDVVDTKAMETLWKVQEGIPTKDTWYDRGVIHSLQKVVDGDRWAKTGPVKSLIRIGQKNGDDYLEIVKDNFVVADLLPDMASGIDRGTGTRTWSKAAQQSVAHAAAGNPLGVAGVMMDPAVKGSIKQQMIKKAALGEDSMTADIGKGLMFGGRAWDAVAKPAARLAGEAFEQFPKVALPAMGHQSSRPDPKPAKDGQLGVPLALMGKYSTMLQQAQKKGPDEVAKVHYLLHKLDPEYQQMYQRLQQKKEREGR